MHVMLKVTTMTSSSIKIFFEDVYIYMCGSISKCKTDILSVKDLVAERISKIATTTVGLLCCNFLQKFMNVYKVIF